MNHLAASALMASSNSSDGLAAGAIFFIVVFYAAMVGFGLYIYARIISRAGYPWPWVFMILVPLANFVMLCIFAFKEWPVETEVKMLRAQVYGGQYPQGGQYSQYPVAQYPTQPEAQYPTQPGTQYPTQSEAQYPDGKVPPTSPYGG